MTMAMVLVVFRGGVGDGEGGKNSGGEGEGVETGVYVHGNRVKMGQRVALSYCGGDWSRN